MKANDAVGNKETTRRCPACRSPISVRATTCRYCGRNVPPPLQEIRRLTESLLKVAPGTTGVCDVASLVRDITTSAVEGKLGTIVGRSNEIGELVRSLHQPAAQGRLIVGPDGSGKTTLLSAVALSLAQGMTKPELQDCRIVHIDQGVFRGAPEHVNAKLQSLIQVLGDKSRVIIFLDDLLSYLHSTTPEAYAEKALLALLAQEKFRFLATATEEQYQELCRAFPELSQCFVRFPLKPTDAQSTLDILRQLLPLMESNYGVKVSRQALVSAVEMTQEFLPKEPFPGKAVDVLRQACSRYRRKLNMRESYPAEWLDEATMQRLGEKVSSHDVKRAITELRSIDIDAVEAELWRQKLEQRLARYVIGQQDAIRVICVAVTRMRLRFNTPGRPAGVMLFAGPKGSGKRHTARVLAEQLLGSCEDFVAFDMTEYSGKDAAEELFGFVPGRGGDIDTGALSCVIRDTPFAIVVFEGIDKAHREVLETLLPALESGVLRDGQGHELRFNKCLIIFTLNGPKPAGQGLEQLQAVLLRALPKEVVETIEVTAPFDALDSESIRTIIQRAMQEFYKELRPREIRLRVHEDAYKLLAQQDRYGDNGVRNLASVLEQKVFEPVRKMITEQKLPPGTTLEIASQDSRIAILVDPDT